MASAGAWCWMGGISSGKRVFIRKRIEAILFTILHCNYYHFLDENKYTPNKSTTLERRMSLNGLE